MRLMIMVAGDSIGCKNSTTLYVLISGIECLNADAAINISPNPSHGSFTIEWPKSLVVETFSIDVVNTIGQNVFSSNESPSIGTSALSKKEINLTNFSDGVYYVTLRSENFSVKKKIVITR